MTTTHCRCGRRPSQLVAYRSKFDHLIDDELAGSMIDLRREVKAMEWPLSPAHYSTLREIGWCVQEIVEALEHSRYAAFREQLGDLLPRVTQLAADQHRARFGDA
ncbi:hypothetical protein [Nonomuraea dietziae]|uniref:hypothetical protein n=1 Tax=Nonomuraea dietziae TaxID=65515 RepID=UPI0031E10ED4